MQRLQLRPQSLPREFHEVSYCGRWAVLLASTADYPRIANLRSCEVYGCKDKLREE
jgi:hypothetical protein